MGGFSDRKKLKIYETLCFLEQYFKEEVIQDQGDVGRGQVIFDIGYGEGDSCGWIWLSYIVKVLRS